MKLLVGITFAAALVAIAVCYFQLWSMIEVSMNELEFRF